MGIGGISMSGLAEILHAKGFTVVGSDAHESAITDHLESLGIQITYGQRAENITPDIDVLFIPLRSILITLNLPLPKQPVSR